MNCYKWTVRQALGTREDQQDAALVKEIDSNILAVVCDGMGGLEGGSEASKAAATELIRRFEAREPSEAIKEFFLNTVDILDEKVYNISDALGKKMDCGTTLVSIFLNNHDLDWLSVGDSRLYIIRNNEIVRATRDHNYKLRLDELLKSGAMPPEEYAAEMNKGDALMSFIGMGGISLMDISQQSFTVEKDDYILITSDGLYKILEDEKIKDIILSEEDIEKSADKLLSAAQENSNGVQDNTTFVLVKITT